ncbi:MAG: hypothetical protein LBB73_05055 [Dysgonamonadaceae bacterium]|jgi:hypothetical protein|nr:hypothetical protein [Dysgonamonadaceae bacterium]
MMKQNRIFIVWVCAVLFSAQTVLQARNPEPVSPRYAFSLEPLYLYNGGLRLNVEKRLKPKDWLELNITGYYLPHNKIETREYQRGDYFTSNSEFDYISGLSGLGIGSAYKHYFFRSFFVGGGASYTLYRVQYPALGMCKYREGELDFYEYQYLDLRQIFNKFTTHISIGGRSSFRHRLFIEYYFGLGYAHSLYHSGKEAYNRSPFGFGHTGAYPATGIKIGFNIR